MLRSRVHIFAYFPAITVLLLTMMPMGLSALANTELAITNNRIIGRMRKQHLAIPFKDIETVTIRRGLLGMLFNYGNLTISGNGIRVRFPGITKPKDMKTLIDNAIERALFPEYASEFAHIKPKAPTESPLPKPEPKIQPTPPEPKPTPITQSTPTNTIPTYKDPNSW